MAQDGSREVEWIGQAFPYLPSYHKAQGPQSYGAVQHSQGGGGGKSAPASSGRSTAGTGTWDGPAPRGGGHQGGDHATSTAAVARDPEYIWLNNGTKMPIVGFGTFKLQEPGLVKKALEVGYRHIDCASLYHNEAMVGKELAEWQAAWPHMNRREDVYMVSKVFNDAHRPELLRKSCEKTLQDLGCGYLDLYLVHWPEAWMPGADNDFFGHVTFDDQVTMEDTWRAMEKLVDDGLAKSIGVSNFSLREVEHVLSFARIKPVCNQVELHPFLPQRKLVGNCLRLGVPCVAYSPMGGPSLVKANDLLTHPTVCKVAAMANKTPAQVVLKWGVQRGVPVLPKTSKIERVAENFDVLSWKLTHEQKAMLDDLQAVNKRFCDIPWKRWDDGEQGGVPKPSAVLDY